MQTDNVIARPDTVVVLGKPYAITYVDKPSEVDIFKRQALWGQIDYWTRTIRIYGKPPENDICDVLLHEILHGIVDELSLRDDLQAGKEEHLVGLLAMALADVLERNGWLRIAPPAETTEMEATRAD